MTKTHQLLILLLHGKPMTYEEIMEGTGWTLAQAHKIVHYMAVEGYVTHLPTAYVITPVGVEHQKIQPQTPSAPIDKKVEARRAKRKRERENRRHMHTEASMASEGETTVQQALRTQPNCVFAIGEMSDPRRVQSPYGVTP